MEKSIFKNMNFFKFLSFVFIIASAGIALLKLTELPPEYTMVTAALLFGAVGALQCINIQKSYEQMEDLKNSMEEFKLTASNDDRN